MTSTFPDPPKGDEQQAGSSTRRFSWPMRVFLAWFLLDMALHSLLPLTPYSSWRDEAPISIAPKPLPTRAELAEIGERSGNAGDQAARLGESFGDAVRYFAPWPDAESADKIDSMEMAAKYAVSWIGTRTRLISRAVGVNHGWTMYSPGVGTKETVGRLRLIFADGSTEIHRTPADPEDVTRFSRWWAKRPLQYAVRIHDDDDARRGYCHWLARQIPQNGRGSRLKSIEVFNVTYHYAAPDVDPLVFLRSQNGPPAGQIEPVCWTYDVATKQGRAVR